MKKIKLIIIIVFALIVFGSILYFIFGRKQTPVYSTAVVTRGNIVQTVNETGTVKSKEELSLSFLNSGRVKKINYDIGTTVTKDSIIAELDVSALNISKKEAQANLDVARSNLSKLVIGATAQDINLARANLSQAKAAYESAVKELEKVKKTAAENIAQAEKTWNDLRHDATANAGEPLTTYKKAINDSKQNAINSIDSKLIAADTALDMVDRTINDQDAKDLISVKNPTYLALTKSDYNISSDLLIQANLSLNSARADSSDQNINAALAGALIAVNKVFETLGDCFTALENSITGVDLTQTQLDIFKTNISAQQTLLATAVTTIESSRQAFNGSLLAFTNALNNAENIYTLAKITGEQQIVNAESKVNSTQETINISQAQYDKAVSPADKNDIQIAQARVRQAQASVDSISNQIENSIIKAPINGTITKVDIKTGEQLIAGSPVISMLGDNNFEIEVLISEADIAKVMPGDKAEITLDAFGDDVKFKGQVVFIEPAETVVQGVIYYKVKTYFDITGQAVKSGMTANVMITTGEKNNVLVVPSRAIIEKNGQSKIVRVLIDNQLEEKPVTTGLSGDEGMIEILSGLNENETVVTYIN